MSTAEFEKPLEINYIVSEGRSLNRGKFLVILGFYNAFVLGYLEKSCCKRNRNGKCFKRSAMNTAQTQDRIGTRST